MICQQRVHEIDRCSIYGLKKVVAEFLRTSPYMIDLVWMHTGEILDNYLVVTNLPTESPNNQMSFNAVVSHTRYRERKAHEREMLILEDAGETASWPSMNSSMSSP